MRCYRMLMKISSVENVRNYWNRKKVEIFEDNLGMVERMLNEVNRVIGQL